VTGATGPAGPAGAAGIPGTNGVAKTIVRRTDVSVAPNTENGTIASCQSGEKLAGGGAFFAGNTAAGDAIVDNSPVASSTLPAAAPADGATPTGWYAGAINRDLASRTLSVYAVCVS
jgi:hypothetical protein